jgi:aminoglycoside phosphotransferase (APT) family kinase protein
MQVVTSKAMELTRTDGRIDASMAGDIARWLRGETGAENVHVTAFERLPGGAIQDNWTLDVEVDGGLWQGAHGFVLRTDALSGVSASLTRAAEFAVLRVAHGAGVIAPEPLFLCSDLDVIGRVFFIMRRVRGIAAGHRLTREPLLVPDGDALAESLGANLARIHAIRPPREELNALRASSRDHALATIAQYRTYLDSLADAYPGLEWALRWCETRAPEPWDTTLIHRDYRTGNYLVDGGGLTAVLDWEFAAWGDAREDIGWFTARCWRFGAHAREAGGLAAIEPFMRGYESIAGRRLDRTELNYWQAMAHLRWAIIALQQAQRHVAGGERSLELALTGRIVHELEYELLQLISGGNA